MKTAAIIIAYHPDKALLCKNIEAFINDVDIVLIHRNSDDDMSYLTYQWGSKIKFIGGGNNQYIAKPLNEALKYCHINGYNWLLTMDQDSLWKDFSGFKSAIENVENNESIAIYAPNVNYFNKNTNAKYLDIEWVIQSGMLLNVNVCLSLGGFREDYKIYGVDEEFCYWANLHDKKVRILPRFNLKQQYGTSRMTRWGFYVYDYSPIVRYFMIRNMIWMKREFPKSTTSRRILSVIAHNTRDITFCENKKFAKLKMFTKGIFHGLTRPISKRETFQSK